MTRCVIHWVVAIALVAVPRLVFAQTKTCDGLSGPKRQLAVEILKSQHPYECCDGTIWDCLHRKRVCRLATRLANDVCRRAQAGKSKAAIERELSRRATSMMGKKYNINLSGEPRLGDGAAKVKLVAYMCARCPYCARITPALYKSITAGRLKGKAQFYLRLFPIRSHKHSTISNMALLASKKLGKFWEFLLHVYAHFDRFDPDKLPDCAQAKGMNREKFKALLKDGNVRAELVDSKKEGVRNNVNATPTFYINGRKYQADLSIHAIEDVVEEEHDRLTGKQYE